MMSITSRSFTVLLLAALLLLGCGAAATPQPTDAAINSDLGTPQNTGIDVASTPDGGDSNGGPGNGYPVPPQQEPTPGTYPPPIVVPTIDPDLPYPPPEPVRTVVVAFDEPLQAGATEVTGKGLPGLPIILISTSRNGETLGTGRIGQNGLFSITVPPLEKGTVIGAQTGDLAGTGYGPEDLLDCAGCRDLPLIGLLVAQAVVN